MKMVGDPKVKLKGAIKDLRKLSDIIAVGIVRRDGLIIAHDLPGGVDPRRIAAMTAAIVGTSEMAAQELEQGEFSQTVIECDQGKIVSCGAGEEALLVTLVEKDANLGLVLIQMERTAKRVEEILKAL
ncbi:MAG: roadblock/LC7 domain-containing protein [Candidatus Hydrothermarchaeota archaeon]